MQLLSNTVLAFLAVTSSVLALPQQSPSNGTKTTDPAWKPLGCHWDMYANDRLLRHMPWPQPDPATCTVETCTSLCDQEGYMFAGVEYQHECYCDNRRPDAKWIGGHCHTYCPGNPAENCGGSQSLFAWEKAKTT